MNEAQMKDLYKKLWAYHSELEKVAPKDRDDNFWKRTVDLMAKIEAENETAEIKDSLHAMLLCVNNQLVREWKEQK